jgi:hypothetical protein
MGRQHSPEFDQARCRSRPRPPPGTCLFEPAIPAAQPAARPQRRTRGRRPPLQPVSPDRDPCSRPLPCRRLYSASRPPAPPCPLRTPGQPRTGRHPAPASRRGASNGPAKAQSTRLLTSGTRMLPGAGRRTIFPPGHRAAPLRGSREDVRRFRRRAPGLPDPRAPARRRREPPAGTPPPWPHGFPPALP